MWWEAFRLCVEEAYYDDGTGTIAHTVIIDDVLRAQAIALLWHGGNPVHLYTDQHHLWSMMWTACQFCELVKHILSESSLNKHDPEFATKAIKAVLAIFDPDNQQTRREKYNDLLAAIRKFAGEWKIYIVNVLYKQTVANRSQMQLPDYMLVNEILRAIASYGFGSIGIDANAYLWQNMVTEFRRLPEQQQDMTNLKRIGNQTVAIAEEVDSYGISNRPIQALVHGQTSRPQPPGMPTAAFQTPLMPDPRVSVIDDDAGMDFPGRLDQPQSVQASFNTALAGTPGKFYLKVLDGVSYTDGTSAAGRGKPSRRLSEPRVLPPVKHSTVICGACHSHLDASALRDRRGAKESNLAFKCSACGSDLHVDETCRLDAQQQRRREIQFRNHDNARSEDDDDDAYVHRDNHRGDRRQPRSTPRSPSPGIHGVKPRVTWKSTNKGTGWEDKMQRRRSRSQSPGDQSDAPDDDHSTGSQRQHNRRQWNSERRSDQQRKSRRDGDRRSLLALPAPEPANPIQQMVKAVATAQNMVRDNELLYKVAALGRGSSNLLTPTLNQQPSAMLSAHQALRNQICKLGASVGGS